MHMITHVHFTNILHVIYNILHVLDDMFQTNTKLQMGGGVL